MPLDLNQYDVESLTEVIRQLPPGRTLISADGQTIRRRKNLNGYDCGVGTGGYGSRRAWKPQEAAHDMLKYSAQHTHKDSLGGEVSYPTFEKAIESVRKGTTTPTGQNPATKALRRILNDTTMHIYRVRAHKAREAMSKGNVAEAVRHIEGIREHAGVHGRLKDVTNAEDALRAIQENYDYDIGNISLKSTKIERRVKGTDHYVYQDGKLKKGPTSLEQAEKFETFLKRNAAKQEAVADIEKEVNETPQALREDAA